MLSTRQVCCPCLFISPHIFPQVNADNAAAMDTQDGEQVLLLTICFLICLFTDHVVLEKTDKGGNGAACSVRLPYSLVPGIDFSSSAYQRVLATLAKQVHNDVKHQMVSCPELPSAADAAPMDCGMSYYSYRFTLLKLILSFIIDKSIPAISEADYKVIKQSSDIVSDDTIIDLIDDTPDADNYLIDSLRLQIIQGCQHLRSRLTSVNGLMRHYNALNKSATKK